MTKIILCVLTFLISYSSQLVSQPQNIVQIPMTHQTVKESVPIIISENEYLLFYVNSTGDSIFLKRTYDAGWSWSMEKFVSETGKISEIQESIYLTGLKTNSGRLLLAWSVKNDSMKIIMSDTYGNSWTDPVKLPGSSLIPDRSENLNLSQLNNNSIVLSFNSLNGGRVSYLSSKDDGENWTEAIDLKYSSGSNFIKGQDFSYVSLNENSVLGICSQKKFLNTELICLRADNESMAFPDTSIILRTSEVISRFKLQKTEDGYIWIIYQVEETALIDNFKQYDIYYLKSEDNGYSWVEPQKFTNYLGDDHYHSVSTYQNLLFTTFFTKRFNNKYGLAIAELKNASDDSYPPYIIDQWIHSQDENTFNFRAKIIYDSPDFECQLTVLDTLLLGYIFDDGLHNDEDAHDYNFGNDFPYPQVHSNNTYELSVNKISLPFDHSGNIAGIYFSFNLFTELEVLQNHIKVLSVNDEFNLNYGGRLPGGRYDDIVFLFAGGFVMSGIDNNGIWANGVMHSALVKDYQPGIVGSDENDINNKIYVIKAGDQPFGYSWQEWRKAVELGAEFYDGDNDGIYNPVDKNFDGAWSPDEDMPLLLGDETVWFVMNDGVPSNIRRWQSEPRQIEIAQTIFASALPELENVIFLRYKITNRSVVTQDSVYFGFYADADIGDAVDDLVGSDTTINSGFVYNHSDDNIYGINPPAFFTTFLQGPIRGSNNTNDSAYIRLGENLGVFSFPSSKNLNMTSHMRIFKGDPLLSDPNSVSDVRNYLQGFNRQGEQINPCNTIYGQVLGGINCNEVNPIFWFSGDPVQQLGWLDKIPSDVRKCPNIGPFSLEPNEPQEIIAAYVVGRGTTALNSITVARELVKKVIEEYESNFSSLTYKPGNPTNPVVSYELYQNYPNPFNPSTTIRFEIPEDGIVTLKVFDILGKEVKTLNKQFRTKNRYEIVFDASGLSSGVYFYQIQINNFLQTKKMIYIR